jgi:hypothetical protein
MPQLEYNRWSRTRRNLEKGQKLKKTILAVAVATLVSTPALAAHNNPWAKTTDTLLAKSHDDNQEKSLGKPGQDQMQGDMAQKGAGNLGGGFGGTAPADGHGHMGGGNGGGGNGGGGNGQG